MIMAMIRTGIARITITRRKLKASLGHRKPPILAVKCHRGALEQVKALQETLESGVKCEIAGRELRIK